MPLLIEGDRARFDGVLSVHDCEALLEWLVEHPSGQVDMAACEHLHVALLQALMAYPREVVRWPEDPVLARWIEAALTSREEGVAR